MIIEADMRNIDTLTVLAGCLWPHASKEDLVKDLTIAIEKKDQDIYLYNVDGVGSIAFIQVSLRYDYVEGCNNSPVAYIEGIYVSDMYRRKKIGAKLIEVAKKWALKNKCSQIASDCTLDNKTSIEFHKNSGFEEVNKVVCFKQDI